MASSGKPLALTPAPRTLMTRSCEQTPTKRPRSPRAAAPLRAPPLIPAITLRSLSRHHLEADLGGKSAQGLSVKLAGAGKFREFVELNDPQRNLVRFQARRTEGAEVVLHVVDR